MNKHIFCSRKGGAKVGGRWFPSKTTTQILGEQAEKMADKIKKRTKGK